MCPTYSSWVRRDAFGSDTRKVYAKLWLIVLEHFSPAVHAQRKQAPRPDTDLRNTVRWADETLDPSISTSMAQDHVGTVWVLCAFVLQLLLLFLPASMKGCAALKDIAVSSRLGGA